MRPMFLWLLACVSVATGETTSNWSSNYPPCNRHSELTKTGHLDLGVRVATANPSLAEQFRYAMDFWASVLDLDWNKDDSENCSIQLVDGERELFQSATIAARSQLPDRLDFQGWIAFNPALTLSKTELYRIAVHEIGHILGLHHSSNAMSVMYYFDMEGLEWLDATDLAALATRHKLRIAALDKPVNLFPRVSNQTAESCPDQGLCPPLQLERHRAIRPAGGPRAHKKKRQPAQSMHPEKVGNTPWLGFPYKVHA